MLKERKHPKDVCSYIPVTLTNIICKIDDRQFGFKKKSTLDSIPKITTKILKGFRRKEKTAGIIFDIEKAYDKVNRDKTLE